MEMVRTGMFNGEMDVALCDLCAAQARTPHFVPKESRTREWTCLPPSPAGRWGGRAAPGLSLRQVCSRRAFSGPQPLPHTGAAQPQNWPPRPGCQTAFQAAVSLLPPRTKSLKKDPEFGCRERPLEVTPQPASAEPRQWGAVPLAGFSPGLPGAIPARQFSAGVVMTFPAQHSLTAWDAEA